MREKRRRPANSSARFVSVGEGGVVDGKGVDVVVRRGDFSSNSNSWRRRRLVCERGDLSSRYA